MLESVELTDSLEALGLAVVVAGASGSLRETSAVGTDSLSLGTDSEDSKLARCFFLLSTDARPAASAFLFTFDLGAIVKLHSFEERRCVAVLENSDFRACAVCFPDLFSSSS